MKARTQLKVLCGCITLAVTAVSCADSPGSFLLQSATLIHETYFIATPSNRGMVHRLDWTQLTAQVDDHWKCEFTSDQLIGNNALDETFVEYSNSSYSIRAGRLRPALGLGGWSDLYYNVVARMPIVRFMPLADKYGLLGLEAGARTSVLLGKLDFTLGVADSAVRDTDVTPRRSNLLEARLEAPLGRALVGLSANSVRSGALGSGGQVYSADVRWLRGFWKLVAEADAGSGSNRNASGYYADLTYRIPSRYRPMLGVRQEEYHSADYGQHLTTVGLRFLPSKELSCNLNYGFDSPINLMGGSDAAPFPGFKYGATLKGWSFQTMLTFRFDS